MIETELAQRMSRGEEVVLATVIRLDGAPPSHSGAKAIFGSGGQLAGTLGCSEFDSQAREASTSVLTSGTPGLRTFHHDLGSIEVYLEPHLRRPLLVILGDTPVARALARMAAETGFETTSSVPSGPRSDVYAVHTDHDAPGLVEALQRLFEIRPRFVGLMGSRRHTGHHLEALRARGMDELQIERIQSPVGLDIGAQTPGEIALSILAGLVAIRHGAQAGWKDPTAPPS
jgi:xanthine dehydrogenase accessory factor